MEPSRFRVGVLTPMPSELRPVVKAMTLTPRGDGAYVGTVGVVDVVAMRTGMGLARATDAVTRLLDREAVDHVMVVGIAGGIGATRVGDIVCPAIVVDGSTRVTFTATPIGPVDGTISSSDEFVVDPARLDALVQAGVRAVDMETSSIAAVCVARGCAWPAVRVGGSARWPDPHDGLTRGPRAWGGTVAGLGRAARVGCRGFEVHQIGSHGVIDARDAAADDGMSIAFPPQQD